MMSGNSYVMKLYKSGGPDNCHPRVLLELKESVVQPLYLIFSKSLRDGILPTMWKKATVTAIHKKGTEIFAIIIDQ